MPGLLWQACHCCLLCLKVLNTLLNARVSVVMRQDVECSTHWVCGLWGTAFPYYRNGELVNIKYRSLDKEFSQVPKAEKVLFGVDDCKGASEIIIVEGEMDKLALEEAGFRHVVSVPDGAPPRLFTYVFPSVLHTPFSTVSVFTHVMSLLSVFLHAVQRWFLCRAGASLHNCHVVSVADGAPRG